MAATDALYVDAIRTMLAHLKSTIKEAQDAGLVVRVTAESEYSNPVDLSRTKVTAYREY